MHPHLPNNHPDTHRYIKSTFRRVDPARPLPQPEVFGKVGIVCPACLDEDANKTTPLKYIIKQPLAWRVAVSSYLTPPHPISYNSSQYIG